MLSVTIKVTGDKEIARKLTILGAGIEDLSLAMREIGKQAILYYSTIGFTDRGRPYNAPWPPYSSGYSKSLGSRGNSKFSVSGNTMLVRTGAMQQGFFAQTGRDSVIIDNRAPYYKYHQSSAPRTKMPYRPMAGINGAIKTMVKETIRANTIAKIKAI